MEQQNENKSYVLLTKEGKIVCLINNEIKYKYLGEIKDKNTIFTFWSNNIEEFKSFITALETFKTEIPLKNLLIEELSFLEMKIEDDGSIVFS